MKRLMLILTMIGLSVSLLSCSALGIGVVNNTNSIQASGSISAVTTLVSPEIGGKVSVVYFDKGDTVKAGDVLFKLDDQILNAQSAQADAAIQVAQANLDLANQKLANAHAQYDQVNQAAHLQDQANHTSAWQITQDSKITLPPWYFDKNEQIASLQVQVTETQNNVTAEQAKLDSVLKDANNQDFVAAEKRLLQAEQNFTIATQTLNEAKAAKDNTDLQDAAQKDLDTAQSELDAAQKNYDQMLSTDASTKVMEARARMAVAREQLLNTQDALNRLMTGDQSASVQIAQTAIDEATAGVSQAQAALTQAQAASDLIKVQIDKLTVTSPVAGTILSRPVNAGEVTAAGATVFEIGSLDQVTLSVYIPESQYGKVQLGQQVNVTADSFPGNVFPGKVAYISDQAEFTPRNVQTVESRSTTVYKIEISLPNADHSLKPGMPADATIATG
jgi:HlyD family secretion protein